MDFWKSFIITLGGFSFNYLVSILVVCHPFEKKKHFAITFPAILLLYGVVLWIYPGEVFLMNTLQISFITYYFFLPFSLILIFLFLNYKMSWNEILFYAIMGWFVEHVISAATCIISCFCGIPIRSYECALIRLGVFFVGEIIFAFLISKTRKNNKMELTKFWKTIVIAVASLLFLTIISQVKSLFPATKEAPIAIMIYFYSLIIAILVLAIMFSIFKNRQLEDENEKMENILHLQAETYRSNRENVNMINIRCHDLSKEISLINKINLKEEDQEILSSLEKRINIYGNAVKTGCEALDVLIASKSLIMENNHIHFTCIADGSLLSFMSSIDIFSLFGNALDNAIEASLKEEKDKRLISMNLSQQKGFLCFEMQNYCSHLPESKKNFPTTKKDKDYHGFGIKGMKYIAEKYGGSFVIKTDNNLFKISVFLPLK